MMILHQKKNTKLHTPNTIINNTTNNDNSTNTNINNNITVKIKNVIYPFGKEAKNGFDLPNSEWIRIMNRGFVSPVELIISTHFNKDLPQYHNVYLPDPRNKYVKYFNGDRWIVDEKKTFIPQLLNDKVDIIIDKYEELKTVESCNKAIKPNMHQVLPNLAEVAQDETDKRTKEIIKDIKLTLHNYRHCTQNTERLHRKNNKVVK